MRPRLLDWLILIFRRPLKLSDAAVLLRPFRRRRSIPEEPEEEFRATRPSGPPQAQPGSASSWRDDVKDSAVDVSEQPLDTLPAELQDELRRRDPPRA
jgi:hypothetical protein